MPPKAAPAAASKAAKKAPTVPNPLFPARARSQRVGGDIRVSINFLMSHSPINKYN